jgi:hypothetical protein
LDDAGKLNEYMSRHKNTRTGEVNLDREKIEEETGMGGEQINDALRTLISECPRRWLFSK